LLGLNGRMSYRGNNRFTEIDLQNSIQTGMEEIFEERLWQAQHPAYYRFDLGVKLTIN